MVKVLIVDDSAVVRTLLRNVFESDSRFSLLKEVADGKSAVDFCAKTNPDLIIMDINMPVMDGIMATKLITENSKKNFGTNPTIIIFSTEDASSYSYKALSAGAVEIIKKPVYSEMSPDFFKEFCDKLYSISKKFVKAKNTVEMRSVSDAIRNDYKILLIGASTGGPTAVQRVLKDLGPNFKIPILITQHIDRTFDVNFANWLTETTCHTVELAKEGTEPLPGHTYLAPATKHLELIPFGNGSCKMHLSNSAPVHFLRPAVDPMFNSAASIYGRYALAILLTGMGNDGAEGCVNIKNNGGYTIAEAASTCVVFGMPKAAIMEGGASAVLPLHQIGTFVKSHIS